MPDQEEPATFFSNPIRYLQDVDFGEPGRLWWVLLVALLAVAYMFLQYQRRGYAVRFTNLDLLDKIAPERPDWRRHLPPVLMLLGLTVGVLAFADPARAELVAGERATIIMAIDTSLSMLAEDVDPSRIDGAKEAAISFLDELPPELNVGLVSFNGIASIRVAPTTNRGAVRAAVNGLELGEATAIGEAILAGLESIEDMLEDSGGGLPPARIVLMSDGETTVGRSDEVAIEAAQKAAIPVSTIAFGTDGGFIMLEPDPSPIAVPVNRDALSAIADATGGEFFAAASTEELRQVYSDIGSSIGFEEEKVPIAPAFVGAALILLFLAAALSLLWSNRLP